MDYTEKHKVSCSGFLPKSNPMQQSCSHYNGFCSSTYTSMQPLQCDLHPHVAEHQGRTDCARNDPNRNNNLRTQEVYPSSPPGATLYTENHKVSCSGFLPKRNPMQQSCSHYSAFSIHTLQARNDPSRNRRTQEVPFIAAWGATLYTENHKVSCSGFLPKTNPMQQSCSHCSKRSSLEPLYTEKHKVLCSGFPQNKPQSCSHYNTFCSSTTRPCSHYDAVCIHMEVAHHPHTTLHCDVLLCDVL